jgi:hypothetical protein
MRSRRTFNVANSLRGAEDHSARDEYLQVDAAQTEPQLKSK